MSATRSPSPAGSPEPLTPRSKIKALLATVDSSEDEETTNEDQKLKKFTVDQLRSGLPTTRRDDTRVDAHNDEVDSSSDSEVEVRPRGRLASRMQAAQSRSTAEVQSNTTRSTVETPVATTSALQNVVDQGSPSNGDTGSKEADDDDDELPTAPHRRLLGRKAGSFEQSPQSTRSASPGLFVSSPARPSPAKSQRSHNLSDSEDDLPATKSDRFKALVERKRQERLAREAAEEAKREARRAEQERLTSELDVDEDGDVGITDDEGGRTLTQGARPTRKASKKAIEEMSRETQRMARNMQLAHEAKTKKKITTASLFERFNFRQTAATTDDAVSKQPKTASSSRPTTPQSDVDARNPTTVDTPPSSPPSNKKQTPAPAVATVNEADGGLPGLNQVLDLARLTKPDKGKGKAATPPVAGHNHTVKPKRHVRVRFPVTNVNAVSLGMDDDLIVTTTIKDKINAVFDSVPAKSAQKSNPLQALKALAGVRSPGKGGRKRRGPASLTPADLQNQLFQRARQQAKVERERRLEMLKAKGIVVQSAEERERQMQEVDDLVAKAREEAQAIMKTEREEAKRAKVENGEVDPLAWDDSDDEEYQDPGNEADAEASEVELSGSEEEESAAEDEGDGEVDDAASRAAEAEEEDTAATAQPTAQDNGNEEDDDELMAVLRRHGQKRKRHDVLSDDDEDAQVEATPRPAKTPATVNSESPAAPTSVLRSNKKSFIPGLPVEGPAGLGLTQIFAGTMDDSQMSPRAEPTQSMMPDIDSFPDSNFSATAGDAVVESQGDATQHMTQGIQLNFSQSQMRNMDSLLRNETMTQVSEIEPSQDAGLAAHTPLRERFVEPPHSTVDTLPATPTMSLQHDSPLIRKGRLRRKMDVVPEEDVRSVLTGDDREDTAFSLLREGANAEKQKKIQDDFNRKKSKAKEMVQEQAEESEDEYAGIGGADGEDSDDDSAASMKDLIDDEAGNDADDRKLAAFYADRERVNDEKEVEKLFKDITSGMLRRKRGADYDLSDSDDGGEARRRMKRRQFAKMQKALFSDERVKKMAENPGNQAFLRTMEDHDSGDDLDFLDIGESREQTESSQSQSQATGETRNTFHGVIPDSQPQQQQLGARDGNRLPGHLRRTKEGRKPSNIGEVRETLSDLLDERHGSVIPATEAGSDDEEHDAVSTRSDKENEAPRRASIVDRISLKRQSSSTLSSASSSSRLAFATTSSSSFKVPALLRRATTNSLASNDSAANTGSSNGVSGKNALAVSAGQVGQEGAKAKRAGGRNTGVNAFARAASSGLVAGAKLEETERKRQAKRAKGAERRMGVVGSLLGRGSFE